MPITRVYWNIFILSHFCIFVYIFIKLVIFILSLLSSTVITFLHCMLNILRYEKNILWNWWVECFIVRSSKWCDILGVHISLLCSIFFHSRKLYFLQSPCLLLNAELVSLDTFGKPTAVFFLKISSFSWIILSILLNEFN